MWLQHNKVVNLKIASQHLHGSSWPRDGLVFLALSGPGHRPQGYLPGMVLHNGSRPRWAVAVPAGQSDLLMTPTPLTVTERWRHSFDVFPDADRTQPRQRCQCPTTTLTCNPQRYSPYLSAASLGGTDPFARGMAGQHPVNLLLPSL